jgi:uncharacterized protein YqgV (UPF0045/DUF77 family)
MAEEKNVTEQQTEETAVAAREDTAPAEPIADHSPEALLAAAIERQLPVESIERLLAMRRELKAEWARERYFESLAAFQRECPEIEKTTAVPNKDGTPRYYYAKLGDIVQQVKDILAEHGFSYTVHPTDESVEGWVTAKVVAHHRDGHDEESSMSVPIDPEAYMNAPQKVAAARTFATRYAFLGVLGIVAVDEDDDAQSIDAETAIEYSDQIKRLRGCSSLDELRATGKQLHDRFKGEGDERGVKTVLAEYLRLKAQMEGGSRG